MADSEENGERTEEATAQRREDFRKKGQIAQTKELSTVLSLFATLIVIWSLGKFFLKQLSDVFVYLYGNQVAIVGKSGDLLSVLGFVGEKILLVVLPFAMICGLFGMASHLLQTGFHTKEDALEFNLDLINPLNGIKRLFSLKSVVDGIKAILKLVVIGFITYLTMKKELVETTYAHQYSIYELIEFFARVGGKLFLTAALAMFAIAAADYAYEWWDLEQKMKMTKQEVKEEFKSREGDPQIKARIRRIQRDAAQKRMMDEVPKADVLITNPTHIAIAIKYDVEKQPAPYILAKGADLIAEKMKEIARQNGVPIVENKPLARTIFKTIKVGQAIPRELYNAVAEVLAYIFKLKKRGIA